MLAGSSVQGAVKVPAFPLWQRAALFALGFWACAQTSHYLSVPVFSYVAFWLPAGLYVAVLLLNDTRTWPWFIFAALVGNAVYDLPHGSPFAAFTGFYLANTLEAVAGAWLMRRFVAERPTLENLRELLGMLIFVSGIGPMAGALIGAGTLVWAGMNHSFFDAWETWTLNTALATLLMTPFILVWFKPNVRRRPLFDRTGQIIEAVVLLAALTSYTYYMLVVDKGITAPYKSRLMPFLLWAGLRFGLRGMSVTNLWFALWVTFLTTHYLRGLSPDLVSSGSYIGVLQSFIAMSVLITIIPTIVLVQRDKSLLQLEASEKRFRELFEGAADALFVFDVQGRILDVNEAACKIHGYSKDELLRLSVAEVKGNLTSEESDKLWERIRSKSSYKVENFHRRRDGSVFPVEVSVSPLDSNEQNLFIAVVRDTTERKKAEEALRSSEERFRLLWNQSVDGIRLTDADGMVLMANPAYCRLMRLPPVAIQGQPMCDVYLAEKRAEILAAHRANFAGRSVKPRVETQVTLWNGETPWLDVSNSFMEHTGTEPLLLALFRDITERKRAELALFTEKTLSDTIINALPGIFYMFDAQGKLTRWNVEFARVLGGSPSELPTHRLLGCIANDELEKASEAVNRAYTEGQMSVEAKIKTQQGIRMYHFVARRLQIGDEMFLVGTGYDITEQKQMQTQLLRAQRQQTIGTLASGVAHDLNNILSPLLAGLPILREEITKRDVRQLVDLMENSIHRGADIVKQLLIFGRGGQAQRLPLNPVRQIEEVAKIINETFPKNLRLETSWPTSPWSISADPTQIYQVLLNLAINARDAMPGGGTITIAAENATLDQQQARISPRAAPGDYVLLRVRDTGDGMEPEVLDRIFEPFFTTKEIGKGTGLGLAVVIGAVENHGGFVNVQSKVGEGTEFKVYLPALPGLTESRGTDARPAQPRGNGELILLVDDEPAILKVTAKILEKNGYRTFAASGGAEALQFYSENAQAIKAVVSDLSMPAMDGLGLAAALMNSHPNAKIIIATGLGDTLDSKKLDAFGIKMLLKKPYTSEAILTALHDIL